MSGPHIFLITDFKRTNLISSSVRGMLLSTDILYSPCCSDSSFLLKTLTKKLLNS